MCNIYTFHSRSGGGERFAFSTSYPHGYSNSCKKLWLVLVPRANTWQRYVVLRDDDTERVSGSSHPSENIRWTQYKGDSSHLTIKITVRQSVVGIMSQTGRCPVWDLVSHPTFSSSINLSSLLEDRVAKIVTGLGLLTLLLGWGY